MLLFIVEDDAVYYVDDRLEAKPQHLTDSPAGKVIGLAVRTYADPTGESRTSLYVSTAEENEEGEEPKPNRVLKYEPQSRSWRRITDDDNLPPLPGLALDSAGNLWACGNRGYFYDGRTFRLMTNVTFGVRAQLQCCAGRLFWGKYGEPGTIGLGIYQLSGHDPFIVPSESFYAVAPDGSKEQLPEGLTPLALHVEDHLCGGKATVRLWLAFSRPAGVGDTYVVSASLVDMGTPESPADEIPAVLHYPLVGEEASQFWGVTAVPSGILPNHSRVVMINDRTQTIFVERGGAAVGSPSGRSKFIQWAAGQPNA